MDKSWTIVLCSGYDGVDPPPDPRGGSGEPKTPGTTVDPSPTTSSGYPSNPTSRKHPPTTNVTPPTIVTMATSGKTKAQAVVSPLPRTSMASQKKVNINTVVSRFSYSNEPEERTQVSQNACTLL